MTAEPAATSALGRAALRALLNGMESTLLILEIMENSDSSGTRGLPRVPTEPELLEALHELEAGELVVSHGQHFTPDPSKHGGLPELKLGRDTVTWWSLTKTGTDSARTAAT